MKLIRTGTIACAAILAVGTAQAATVSSSSFNQSDWDTFLAGLGANQILENFEDEGTSGGIKEYDAGLIGTSVGDFSATAGSLAGGGLTVTNPVNNDPDNDGVNVAIRSGNVYGRSNTTTGGSWFLDSNDITELQWDVSIGGGFFDKLVFTLTDAADVGAVFKIFVDGSQIADYVFDPNPNPVSGTRQVINVDFGGAVTSATILFQSLPVNDGFGIDDIVVNGVSAVPLPASALFLLGGLGALGAAARRKRKAA